jgi:arylsulfatase A-like enzyme
MNKGLVTVICGALVSLAHPAPLLAADGAPRPNVLFIAVDDLRPQFGAYGFDQVKSPNLDRLATRGLLFERAYCQQAICMASRASLLSGYRPDRGEISRNGPLFSTLPGALTLNQHFLNHGYETVAMGKIYHHDSDYDTGWSRPHFQPRGSWTGRGYLAEESRRIVAEYPRLHPGENRSGMGPAFEGPAVPDEAYPDGVIAEHAIAELNRLKDKSFFMAVGFAKPHLPFNAPKKYWDLYDPATIKLADNPFAPRGAPSQAATDFGELRGYAGLPKTGPIPDDLARQLIHGYFACISYTDAMIGRVLDELDRLGLTDNTIVVLWGDHGWKLGEHGMWAKHTNFELDTRVPLIISAPRMAARGQRTPALGELVDLYPTLAELAGLPLPPHLEGSSLAPLLNDPARPWKQAAFSQYPRGNNVMGHTIRTDRYRYTEWRAIAGDEVLAREVYDHSTDAAENENIANRPENTDLVAKLSAQLRQGPQAARPPR